MHPKDVANAAALAAVLEASAEKPGNVTPTKSFDDLAYSDFLHAALAMRPHMLLAAERGRKVASGKIKLDKVGLGKIIYDTFEPSRAHHANVNFGIVLMFTPLAVAAGYGHSDLRKSLWMFLRHASPEDTVWIYRAMRKCELGGMELKEKGLSGLDVFSDAALKRIMREKMTPLEVFRLSEPHDRLASEWASGYQICFNTSKRIRLDEGSIIDTYLRLLKEYPDTFIARKAGWKNAEFVSRLAGRVLSKKLRADEMDRLLRAKGNKFSPGTTADMIATSLFIKLMGK